jgi:phosphoglycolate phosphatase-like HAD superfamily hydrolase
MHAPGKGWPPPPPSGKVAVSRRETPMPPTDAIEILRPKLPRGRFRAVLFDFDGTLSLLREGWVAIMTELMLEQLLKIRTAESDEQLAAVVEGIVVGLNGQPTIVQMQRLVDEVRRRGGRAGKPAAYAQMYQDQLSQMIQGRYDDLTAGRVTPAAWAVPGAHALLEGLRERGLTLVLASGTEVTHVRREADMLGLTPYFDETAFFAPTGDDPNFSKRAVIERVKREHRLRGEELLGFGDGVVETQEVRRIGGVAVAVASEEPPRRGVNTWKRDRLIGAGADVVIADYDCHERLLRWLFAED